MTTWDDVQAAQDAVDELEALREDLGARPDLYGGGFQAIAAELAAARELLRLRQRDYALTCLAHPAWVEELGGPGGHAR